MRRSGGSGGGGWLALPCCAASASAALTCPLRPAPPLPPGERAIMFHPFNTLAPPNPHCMLPGF